MRFVGKFKVSDLKPFAGNPRKHESDVEPIVKSIEHFGWTNPILVQEKTNRIIAGHGRLEAARKASLTHVPVIFLKMNDKDATAYTVADNKLAELSTWDDSALQALIADLKLEQYDMSLMGFSPDELNELLTLIPDSFDRSALDDIPAIPDAPTTKPGELWMLGAHTLLCGDSTDPEQVRKAMGTGTASLVFTDPPYGVAYVGKTAKALTLSNDDLGDDGTRALVMDAARAWPLKPGGAFYVCSPAGDQETAFRMALRDAGLTLRQCLVWVKQHFVMGRQDYHWRHESMLYGWAEGAAHYFVDERTQDTVWDEMANLKAMSKDELIELVKGYRRKENTTVWPEDRPTASLLHPTTKPIALIQKAIRNSSLHGEIVFDGFGGSGSTLIAADSLDRKAVVIELDPRYCDVIRTRWETVNNDRAWLVS
jgi:DNA modification methylase